MSKIYKKRVSLGAWLKKGEDVKDQDIVTVANEGITDDTGDFGPREVFLVKLQNGEEKNVAFNQTSINNMVDAFGESAVGWVGKEVKVWLVRQNVAGKFQQVLYVAHPEALFTDDGFVLSADKKNIEIKDIPVVEDEVDIKKIPF